MGYVVYQLEGRTGPVGATINTRGQAWKYIGVTSNLKRRMGEHARDFRRPLKEVLDETRGNTVKITILKRARSKHGAFVTKSLNIHKMSSRSRTTMVVNVQSTGDNIST
jgi:predicted GIY-YIG superfamily endonuclease